MPYLDFNASTPMDPRVREAVVAVLDGVFGNASSIQHTTGQIAAEAVEGARLQVGALVGSLASDVIFTSGATEALTLAILGAALGTPERPTMVVGATEHSAVHAAVELAASFASSEVRVARVDRTGVLDLEFLERLMGPDVGLVVAMHANNETGTLHPVRDIANIAHRGGSRLLCDLTQAAGKVDLNMAELGVDLGVLSSHKIYGPKGAGALIANRQVRRSLVSVMRGGGQEQGLRGGTLNTPAIVGFGIASELAALECTRDSRNSAELIARLRTGLDERVTGVSLVGSESYRLPNTANLRFDAADAEAVLANMKDIEVSTGSACQSAVPSVSHVLLAMGLSRQSASECIRFSVGRSTTAEEIDAAVERTSQAVSRVRALSAA